MTIDDFVKAVRLQTSDAAVKGTVAHLKQASGRKPRERDVQLSKWYNQLDSTDCEMLEEALKEAAELAIFSFLCILDGVSVVEDSADKGELELYYSKGGDRKRLNDPNEQELHNLFNKWCKENVQASTSSSEINAYDSGEACQLLSKIKVGDGLDVHHVPDKHASVQTVQNYSSDTGPAIVLPKPKHRKIPQKS